MNRLFSVVITVSIIAAAGCSSAPKKSPLDGEWLGKNKSFAAKKYLKPMKWSAGHFVVTGSVNDGERESVTRSLVVGKESGGWIFETVTTNAKKEVTGMQMLIKGYDKAIAKNDASQIEIVWIKMLDKNGKINRIEGDAVKFYNVMMKATWENMIISAVNSTSGGAVKVPAGSFAGTTKIHTKVKLVFTVEGDSYLHPDIPVNGVVKSVSGDNVTELLDFGFNGKAQIK